MLEVPTILGIDGSRLYLVDRYSVKDRLETVPDIEPTELASGDAVITKGTSEHFTIGHPA